MPFTNFFPLIAPFVEIQTEKRRLQVGKGFPAGFALVLAARSVRHKQVGDFIEKRLEDASDLAVGSGPVAPPVGGDGLVKMAKRRGKVVAVK